MSWNGPGVGVGSVDLAASCAGTPPRGNFADRSFWRVAFLVRRFRQKIILFMGSSRWRLDAIEPETRFHASRRIRVRALHLALRPERRGRRKCRALASPMARLQKKSRRQSPQVQPNIPAFPARWSYVLCALSPGTGLSCPRDRRIIIHRRSISVGMPGPYVFDVRLKP